MHMNSSRLQLGASPDSSALECGVTAQIGNTNFGGKNLFAALLASLVVYLIVFTLSVLLAEDGDEKVTAFVVLHIGAAASLLVCWRLGRWGRAKYDCFGAALLLAAALLRMQAAIDTLVYGLRIESIPSTIPLQAPATLALFKGEFITQIGLLIIASTWRIVVGKQVERYSFLESKRSEPARLLATIYVAGIAVSIAGRLAPGSFGNLAQFASLMFLFAVASIYFIAVKQLAAFRQVLLAVLLALPMVALALGSGMKEDLFFPLVPASLLYWFRYRSAMPRLFAIVVGFAVLGISQLYVGYVRDATWKTGENTPIRREQAPILQTVTSFIDEFKYLNITDGLNKVSARINLTTTHAITVILADEYGYEPMEVFGKIPVSLIPRVFWPGKPVFQPGAMQTARIQGTHAELANTSSATAAGFITEMYLGAGFFGVMLGAGTYGLLLAKAQRWVYREAPGFGHRAFALILMYWTIRFDEKAVVYAYTSIVFTLVFIWLLKRGFAAIGLRMESNAPHVRLNGRRP